MIDKIGVSIALMILGIFWAVICLLLGMEILYIVACLMASSAGFIGLAAWSRTTD